MLSRFTVALIIVINITIIQISQETSSQNFVLSNKMIILKR